MSRRSNLRTFRVSTALIAVLAVVTFLAFVLITFFWYYWTPCTLSTVKPFEISLIPKVSVDSKLNQKTSTIEYHPLPLGNQRFNSTIKPAVTPAKCPVTIVLILCNDGNKQGPVVTNRANTSQHTSNSKSTIRLKAPQHVKPMRDFGRQINQTIVLLKSIALQQQFAHRKSGGNNENGSNNYTVAQTCVNVLVLSDEKENFDRVQREINAQQWSKEFTRWVNLTFVPVSYPPGSQWMRKLFRPCATLRLFLAELLPQYDSVIYLDTDIIFLRNMMGLWDEFNKFSSNKSLAAMAPCLNHYKPGANHVPFYGKTGLNAGIMLMNLTRIRSSGWTEKILEVTSAFQSKITLADQDILNIYFHSNPEELHELTCDWNFRPFQCRKGSFCQDLSLTQGISALHGNALSFTPEGPEPLFHTVFSTFQNLNLTQSSPILLKKLINTLHNRLSKVQGRSTSDCSRFGAFSILLLNRLNSLI